MALIYTGEETMAGSDAIYYFHGDAARYTGRAEMKHGQMCYEAVFIEGHRIGEAVWTYKAPKQA